MYFVNISCYKKYKLGAEGFEETEWVSPGFAISITKKTNAEWRIHAHVN